MQSLKTRNVQWVHRPQRGAAHLSSGALKGQLLEEVTAQA